MNRVTRWWWRLGKAHWTFEWEWGWRLGWFLQRDCENWTLGVGFVFAMLYVSLEHPWVMKFARAYDSEREIGFRIHDGAIWWMLWSSQMSWSCTTPRWRNGCFHVDDFLLGKQRYSSQVLNSELVDIPLPERAYRATAIQTIATWKRPRWFARMLNRIEFKMLEGEQIPIPGKGENSYDCDEDATYSISFPGNDIEEGIGHVVADILTTRRRRAGRNWRPEKHEQELRRYFHSALVQQLAKQRETIQKLIDEKRALTERCNQAEANLRSAALRESILRD